jgi:hypothetical protein
MASTESAVIDHRDISVTPEPTLGSDEMVSEKPSPAPESVKEDAAHSSSDAPVLTEYPATFTKVVVGIGLALAVFLVTRESKHY